MRDDKLVMSMLRTRIRRSDGDRMAFACYSCRAFDYSHFWCIDRAKLSCERLEEFANIMLPAVPIPEAGSDEYSCECITFLG